jgi:hypothetical protein
MPVPSLRWLIAGCLPRRPSSSTNQVMWDLWWTKWHWGRFSPEYFGFPCHFAFHQLLHNHHHHHLSSGAGTIGQKMASVPSGLSLVQDVMLMRKDSNRVCYMCDKSHFVFLCYRKT